MVCFDVIDHLEATLDSVMMTGVMSFTGRNFWKKLISHKTVKETYLNTTDPGGRTARQRARPPLRVRRHHLQAVPDRQPGGVVRG